jgi:tetratricopeptide (TPR) repeat protein
MRTYTGGAFDGAFEVRAIPHLEAAAKLMERDPDSIEKALVFQRLGHIHMHRGEFRRTLEWAERARAMFTRLGMSMGTSIGTAMTYLGRVDEGLAYNEGNWEAVARSGNLLAVMVLGHELATTLALLRDPRAAIAAGERALRILEGTNFAPGAHAMSRRAIVLASALAGDLERARDESRIVRDIEQTTFFGCVFEEGAAVAFHELARGNTEHALAYVDGVMPVFQQRNLVAAMHACDFVRGRIALARGKAVEAVPWLERSVESCRSGGSVLFELWVLPALAEAYLALGERVRASECIRAGFALLTTGQHWHGLPAPLHCARARLAVAERDRGEAARAIDDALAISRQYGLAFDEVRALEIGAAL